MFDFRTCPVFRGHEARTESSGIVSATGAGVLLLSVSLLLLSSLLALLLSDVSRLSGFDIASVSASTSPGCAVASSAFDPSLGPAITLEHVELALGTAAVGVAAKEWLFHATMRVGKKGQLTTKTHHIRSTAQHTHTPPARAHASFRVCCHLMQAAERDGGIGQAFPCTRDVSVCQGTRPCACVCPMGVHTIPKPAPPIEATKYDFWFLHKEIKILVPLTYVRTGGQK